MSAEKHFAPKEDSTIGAYMAAARFLNHAPATITASSGQTALNRDEFVICNAGITILRNIASAGAGWVAQVSFPKAEWRRYVYSVHLVSRPPATLVQTPVSDETLLQDVVMRVFPLARFESARQLDTEEGWERPILNVYTGCTNLAARLQAEDRFYELVAAEPRLVNAIRKITVSFS
jgi:hypothetical protein